MALFQGDNLFHLSVRGCDAHAIFNETNHSMRILKGRLLPQSTVSSYRDADKRNAVIAAMSKLTKDNFWELQRDFVLNSPSTAASYHLRSAAVPYIWGLQTKYMHK